MSETEKSKQNKTPSTSTTAASSSSSPATTTASSKVSSSSRSSTVTTTSYNRSTTAVSSSSSSCTPKLPSKPPPPLPRPPPLPFKVSSSAPVSRSSSKYPTATAIKKAFVNYMKDSECLDKAANYLYESLLEDAVMGVYLEVHQSVKSGFSEAIERQSEDETAFKIVDTPNYDVFGVSKVRMPIMDCNCPNCDRLVAAAKFAPHLASCMGMGRKVGRTSSRRLANAKEGNSSYFSSNVSDDEDDADWSSEKRRKKIQSSRTNGSKKNGKSS